MLTNLARIVAAQKQVINQQFDQKKKQETCSEECASKLKEELQSKYKNQSLRS